MVERATKAAITVAVLAGVASVVFAVLSFLQTRDVTGSLALMVGLGMLFAVLGVLAWVREDAPEAGLPTVPWMVAIVFAPGVGFVAYLVTRQLAQQATDADA